jgi:hypothetical protein
MSKEHTKTIFYVTVSLLLIIPLIWLAKQPKVQDAFPWLTGNLSLHLLKRLRLAEEKVPDYKAKLVGQSHNEIKIKEDEEVRVWVDFKNVGKKDWKNNGDREFIALNTDHPQDRESIFRTAEWEYKFNTRTYRPGRMSHGLVKPGDVGRFYITLRAPKKPGTHVEHFKLVSEWREWIEGGECSVKITADPFNRLPLPEKRGRWLRVGVHKPERPTDPIKISAGGAFEIRDAAGNLIALYHRNEVVTVRYRNGIYNLEAPAMINGVYDPKGWRKTVPTYLCFMPKDKEALSVLNIEERPWWNDAFNYNRFSGNLFVRHSGITGNTWVINAIPMEAYLRGTHELSNYSRREMQKAFIVAERSYAQHLYNTGGKYKNGYFDISRWTTDQIYHGYSYELQSPNISKAVNETAGQMITYGGQIVTAPFFAQSDGRTKSWSEVWYGEKPWLKSVNDPCCHGRKLLGHGVGMPGEGAKYFAGKGWNYQRILKYYYKGVKIRDFY